MMHFELEITPNESILKPVGEAVFEDIDGIGMVQIEQIIEREAEIIDMSLEGYIQSPTCRDYSS